ncbi:hypothetical protein [Paracoccus sp. ME4]|uniref:phage tail tip fiber protein n=1 Tax=Paracoccus sp. ME4 TaxID=3138066 RepID=UPI00398B4342
MKKLLLISTALAAGFAGPAHADPVTAIATWVSATFSIGAATALAATQFVVGLGLSAIGNALFGPKLGAGGANVSFDVKMGDSLPLSFVVGDYATAGKRKYIGSWGKNTRFITEVIELSALPVRGIQQVWVNDERGQWASENVWGINPADNVDTFSDQGEYAPGTLPAGWITAGRPLSNFSDDGNRIYIKFVDGSQTAADPFLVKVFGDDPDYPWTSAMIGRGKAYAIVTSRFDDDTLTSYPTFLWQPEPLPLYDWRADSTAGGDGAQRWSNPATWQPTRNPAVIAYNIVRGLYFGDEWVFGGKNLAPWRLPVAEWTAAANACDQPVTLASGATQPRYRCGLEISVDMEPASVLDELGRAANMKFAEVGGRLKPIVDLPGSAVLSISDADILITEGQSFSPFNPFSDTFNAISATYPEPGEKWASKDAPEYIDADARDEDGEYRPTSMSYGAVPYARQVQRLMRSQMRDFRRMRRHQFYLPPAAYALEPGIDMISWTSQRNGYDSKLFVVESVAKAPGMNVLVSLREVDPSDYDWTSGFERPVIITPPVNPRPFVQPVNGLTVTGATISDGAGNPRRPAILVACTGDEAGVTRIQIEARRVGAITSVIDTLRPFQEPFAWYLLNVLPMTAYEVRARLVSDLTPRSAWSGWISVTTPDVRLAPGDLDIPAIREDVLSDLTILEEWLDGEDGPLQPLRDEVALAQTEVAEARVELAADIAAAEQLALDNLDIARAYTDTGLQNESVARNAGDQALAAQIQTLTAALTSDNLLDNALFTSGLDGWTVSGFITAQARDTASADPIFATAPTDNFARIIPPGSGTRMMRQDFPVEFAANEIFQWRLKAASAAAGRTMTIRVNWFDASNAQIGGNADTALSLTQNEWRTFSGQHTPPSGAVSMRWQPIVPASGSEPSYLADPAVTRVDQSTIARITALEVVVANQDEAFATFRDSAEARLDDNEAAITNEGSARAAADSALAGQITTVSAVANARNRTFRQGTAPTSPVTGDVWYDTANGLLPKRWSGSAWVNVDDARIAQTAAAVTNEQIARANGDAALAADITTVSATASRARTFRQGTTPVGPLAGDIWFDTSQGNRAFRWSGSAWVPTDDTRIEDTAAAVTAEAIARANGDSSLASQINTVSAVANRARTFRQGTAPTGALVGDIWYDTSNGNIPKRWSGSAWLDVDDARIAQNEASITTEAAARATGDSALSSLLTSVSARTDRGTALGRFRASAVSTGSGALVRIGLAAEASDGETNSAAALFLEARSDGANQIMAVADRFAIVTGTGVNANRRVPFIVQDGVVLIDSAVIGNAAITTARIDDLAVSRLKIQNESVTTYPFAYAAAPARYTQDSFVTMQTLTFTPGRSSPMPINVRFDLSSFSGTLQGTAVRLLINGSERKVWLFSDNFGVFEDVVVDVTTGLSARTYQLQIRCPSISSNYIDISNRFIGILNAYK